MTPELAKVHAALWSRFAGTTLITWGICNRRRIAGTSTWSQHAWCNAEDVSSPATAGIPHRMALLDDVAEWLLAERSAGRLPIGTILWRVRDHFDHIHYEGKPKRTGVPPGSPAGEGENMDIVCDIGDAGIWVRPFQQALNRQWSIARAAGFGDDWPSAALTVDGRFGTMSAGMTARYQKAAGAPIVKLGAIDTRLAVLLMRDLPIDLP